jgi:hypothetical protein
MMKPDWSPNQRVLFTFAVEQILPLLTPNGVWIAPDPAPLTNDEIGEVFTEIRKHARYQGQTLQVTSSEGAVIVLRKEAPSDER